MFSAYGLNMNHDSAERSCVLRNQTDPGGSVPDMTLTAVRDPDIQTVSLEAIYREHYGRFVRFAYTFIGRRDLAEEVVQDSFIQADRHWAGVHRYDDPVGWVRRIVLNRSIDASRRRTNERNALAKVVSITRVAMQPFDADPDDALWSAVRALPQQQAALIALVYVEHLDVHEAAMALELSESTARTQLTRAKGKLAAALRASDAADYMMESNYVTNSIDTEESR
jgi:RNA polymerase sigma factor (sigma-70 family)